MTPAERNKAFRAERARQWKLGVDLRLRTRDTVLALLADAETIIAARLALSPSEWDAYRLPKLQDEVRRAIGQVQAGMGEALISGVRQSWDLGQALIDAPLRVGGVDLSARLPRLDTGVLMAMQSFLTDRIADISTTTVNRINAELANTIIGVQAPQQAVQNVAGVMKVSASRARTIVNDELGRAYSLAGQERMVQAKPILPGLRKQWRRSGKREARYTHMLADGQVVKPDEPFLVGGVKLACPRDPAGPAAHTINCGCTSLPLMKSWEVLHPAEKPFSDEELATSRDARTAEEVRQRDMSQSARKLIADVADDKVRPQGRFWTVGQINARVQQAVEDAGLKLVTTEIAIGDRQIAHAQRSAKQSRKDKQERRAAVPKELFEHLPEIFAKPRAILLEQGPDGPALHYVAVPPPGQQEAERLPSFIVHLRQRDTRMRHAAHNWVATASMVDKATLVDEKRFHLLQGKI